MLRSLVLRALARLVAQYLATACARTRGIGVVTRVIQGSRAGSFEHAGRLVVDAVE